MEINFKTKGEVTKWIDQMLSDAITRYKDKIDPDNWPLLLFYRLLAIKFRLKHSIES